VPSKDEHLVTELALDNVAKQFGDGTWAVRDVSLTIDDGEFFVLVGPSGCGKSTLLSLIVGLATPTSGEIRVDGARVNEVDARERNMAMVFQNYALYPHMSVRDNLAFPLRMARVERSEMRRRVQEAAELLELDELLDRRPVSLSGGQRQRVAMGRALVRQPAAFLLDEPLSNLDARLREQMRVEIARLQKRLGVTTIYVTHDQNEAMTLGDRVAVMRDGLVQQIGTPRQLYETPDNLFVAAFIGSPGVNLMPAHAEDSRLVLPVAELTLSEQQRRALAEGDRRETGRRRTLVAGIRPEHIELADRARESEHTVRFRARVDVLEWTGAEKQAHFAIGDARAAMELGELAGNVGRASLRDDAIPAVARLPADCATAEDEDIELVFDARRLHLFDPASGARYKTGRITGGNDARRG
jgi:multiple sugar transport system ATP-binding protein